MKPKLLFLLLMSLSAYAFSQSTQEIENLSSFAKLYGYVKYFHPSDESAEIDWDAFAIYGAQEVKTCSSQSELKSRLDRLFLPIAPTLQISEGEAFPPYPEENLRPNQAQTYQTSYWQHQGLGRGMNDSRGTYQSVRINRSTEVDQSASFGNLSTRLDPIAFRGKKIKYTAQVKVRGEAGGTGHLWLRVDLEGGRSGGFFDNMGENPIVEDVWKPYEIIGEVDPMARNISLGCFLQGKGQLFVDQPQCFYEDQGEWIEIPLPDPGFEKGLISPKAKKGKWLTTGAGYVIARQTEEKSAGKQAIRIRFEGASKTLKGKPLFEAALSVGDILEEEIGKELRCQLPLALYVNEAHTYPAASVDDFQTLKNSLAHLAFSHEDLSSRLGNVINTWNVFQHFYPYMEVMEIDWDAALEQALRRCYEDQTEQAHLLTLRKLTALLKDGHVNAYGGNMHRYVPPIAWEWIEDQLVITAVYTENLPLKKGDIVQQIDGQAAGDFFAEIHSQISAGTQGWLDYRAQRISLYGPKNSQMRVRIRETDIDLIRNQTLDDAQRHSTQKAAPHRAIDDQIYYLNLDVLDWEAIKGLLPTLEQQSAIICDLRGYPNSNDQLISHLLPSKDTTEAWMFVPRVLYPDQKKPAGFDSFSWGVKAKKPYLGDKKIIFITDGRAISYAESYMGYIEGYDLATIVGQPTAGTNGNVNGFRLPGGISIRWTGMKVLKHDGTQHHGIGILPDVYMEKTIQGLMENRDEFLEKAIELARG